MKILKRALLVFCLVFICNTIIYGQKIDPSRTYKYKMLENNPNNANNLIFKITPLYLDMYIHNLNSGFEVGGLYRFKDKAEIQTTYSQAYSQQKKLSEFSEKVGTNGYSVDDFLNTQRFDLTGSWFFRSSQTNKVMEHDVSHKFGTNYIIKLPSELLMLHGMRFGFNTFNTIVEEKITTNYSTPFGMISRSQNAITNMNIKMLHIGYTFQRLSYLEYELEELGEKKGSRRLSFYADFIYSPSINFSDVFYEYKNSNTGETTNEAKNVNELIPIHNWGFRAGYEYQNILLPGLGNGIEIGMRPGPNSMSYGIYGTFKLFIMLGFRV